MEPAEEHGVFGECLHSMQPVTALTVNNVASSGSHNSSGSSVRGGKAQWKVRLMEAQPKAGEEKHCWKVVSWKHCGGRRGLSPR